MLNDWHYGRDRSSKKECRFPRKEMRDWDFQTVQAQPTANWVDIFPKTTYLNQQSQRLYASKSTMQDYESFTSVSVTWICNAQLQCMNTNLRHSIAHY